MQTNYLVQNDIYRHIYKKMAVRGLIKYCSFVIGNVSLTEGNKPPTKKPRIAKGNFVSRNAYMLVYRLHNTQQGNRNW